MALPSIGAVSAYTTQWKKNPPFAHSSVYRQPNRAGNSHVVGKAYADPSTIITEHFLNDTNEKALLLSAKAVCGTVVTITEIKAGASVAHSNVYVESVRQTKGNACVGPSGTVYVVILEWTVYLPEDWS